MIREPKPCKCENCGEEWILGDQEDNETICLRCEYYETHPFREEEAFEEFDKELNDETTNKE
jgi:hypothetical protein